MQLTDRDFIRLKNYMYNNYGINLEKKRTLIETRLLLVLKHKGFTDFKTYIDSLMQDKTGELVSILVEKLTTNFTYFMREEMHFDFIKENVLQPSVRKSPMGGLKIWSAASSTGEEAYGIAMLASSVFGNTLKQKINITASDISSKVLNEAKRGIYSKDKIGKLPQAWVNNYLTKLNEREYQVNSDIKDIVQFKYFNLNDIIGWEKSKYDVIFCRNVMIYFDSATNQKLTQRLYDSLKPGGYLIIGMSESLSNLNTKFERVKPSIYMKK